MKKVLVLGGTGFVGQHVCEQLNRLGIGATVPTRRMIHGRSVQMLPLVQVVEANAHDEQALARLLPGHDAVVNLVAILHGRRSTFHQVHVELVGKLARAMQAASVRRLVHVSALGASAQGPSLYQATKAEGEAVLRAAGLQPTVLRPSVIFGAGDRFLNLFARLQSVLPLVPLASANTLFQPVWVGDVAQAVVQCLLRQDTIGKTYECTGPEVFTLADMVRLAGRLAGHPRPVFGLPAPLGWIQAKVMECMPGEPLMSTDNLRSMQQHNVATGQHPDLSDLGITALSLEPVAATYLNGCRLADPMLALREQACAAKTLK